MARGNKKAIKEYYDYYNHFYNNVDLKNLQKN